MFHIVEDNSEIREIMTAFIRLLGHSSRPFATADEYLNFLNSHDYTPPIAIFTDIHMPGLGGYEMIEHILAIHPDMKFIVSSGEPQIEDEIKSKVCLFLMKPFSMAGFREVITKIKTCEQEGPSLHVGCSSVGNLKEFVDERHECPKLCTGCAH